MKLAQLALFAPFATLIQAQEAELALRHVHVIPMDEPGLLEDHTVLVGQGRILRLGPTKNVEIPAGCRTIDGGGRYLIPGLTDAHTHTLLPTDFALYLAHGVTTILEMSGNPRILQLREEVRGGERLGPRLFTTSPQFKTQANPMVDREVSAGQAGDVVELVGQFAAQGYDFLKVWGPISAEVHVALCKRAEELGIPVTGHIPRAVGLQATLDHGQSSIAHVEEYWNKFFRNRPDPSRMLEAASATQAAGATVVTTLITYENIAYIVGESEEAQRSRPELRWIDATRRRLWSAESNEYRQRYGPADAAEKLEALAFKQRIAAALHDAGVPLVAGTDCGGTNLSMLPGRSLHRELELLVQAGLEPWEALATATVRAGDFLDEGKSGRIAAGQRADLVLLARNPLEDIRHSSEVEGIVCAGRWFDRAELDLMLDALQARMTVSNALIEATIEHGAEAAFTEYDSREEESLAYDPSAVALSAFYLAVSERIEEAEVVLLRLTEDHPELYQPHFGLAGFAAAAGDREGARASLRAVLRIVPEHVQARAMLSELGD